VTQTPAERSLGHPDPSPHDNVNEASGFLRIVWLYTTLMEGCFSIVWMDREKHSMKWRHFCLEEYGYYDRLFDAIEDFISKNMDMWLREYDVFYQVLPLSEKPKKGRGSASQVSVSRWLWSDLDFKEVVEKPEFEGCKQGDDYSLECYYSEGRKWIHVKRPPLKQILEVVEERLGAKPTIVVDSGSGYHLYFKLTSEIGSEYAASLEEKLVEVLGADKQSKDLARVLRLPGTVNQRVKRVSKVIYHDSSVEIDPDMLEEKIRLQLEETGEEETRLEQEKLKHLGDSGILNLKELLKDAYKPGVRQTLILFLSGWFAKARVHPVDAVKLVKMLHDETDDEDHLKTRLAAVVYSYKKAGIDIDRFSNEIIKLTGVKPYGLEKEINEGEIKGRTGVQELLEDILGEERALSIIYEITKILNTLSPYRDSVVEILDYEKQYYAVANLRRLITVRARKSDHGFQYKERVAIGCPTHVEVYFNTLSEDDNVYEGGLTRFLVVWEARTRKPITIGPAPIDDIIEKLKAEGLITNRRLASDVITAVIEGFINKGRAVIKEEIETPGFYLVKGKVKAIKVDVKEPTIGELKVALTILDELSKWYEHVIDKFATVIKWGLISPFSYIYKQKRRWIPWLYLFGASSTGKTTLGEIVLNMWGLDYTHRKSGSSIDTPARLGHVLSRSTFPVLINEPGNAVNNEAIIEMIKNAVESVTARGRYFRGTYRDIPALASLIFTSNKVLPQDDALLRRMLVLVFTYGDRINPDKAREFESSIKHKLVELSPIGNYVAYRIVNDPDLLHLDWKTLAKRLLKEMYEATGREIPQWIEMEAEEERDIYEDIIENIRVFFIQRINSEYERFVGRVETSVGLEPRSAIKFRERVEIVLKENLIPWMILKDDKVILTTGVLEELRYKAPNLGSLKSLAELLGWNYKRSIRTRKGKVIQGVITSLETFIEFLEI